MGKRHPVELHSRKFATKTEAHDFFKDMLRKYEPGDTVSPQHSRLLRELLSRHPEANEKIGSGIAGFFVDGTEFGSQCFHLRRVDGTSTDFSYKTCVAGQPPSLQQEFYQACFSAVRDTIRARKKALFSKPGETVACSATGSALSIEEAEFRHTSPTFSELVQDFIYSRSLAIHSGMLTTGQDNQYETEFKDPVLASQFMVFHDRNANLAIFHRSVGRKAGRQAVEGGESDTNS